MNQKTLFRGLAVFAVLLAGNLLSACGSSTGSTSSGTGVTTIDALPLSVSPVVASTSASMSARMMASTSLAESGTPLGELDSTTFGSSSSRAMCELSNRFRDSIGSAAQGDLILCYIQTAFVTNSNLDVDIYDGQPHVFALDFGESQNEEDGGGPSKIRITITKDSSGQITDFSMYACGDQGDADAQSEYLNQTIGSDGSFTMVSKGVRGEQDAHLVEVEGTLNSSGRFTSKTIDVSYTYQDTSGDFSGSGQSTLVQGSDQLTYSGFEGGSFSFETGEGTVEGTYSNRVYAVSELLDGNADGDPLNIGLYAIGDGAALVSWSGSDTFGSWSETATEGWNGDTTAPDSEAEEISSVEGQTLPTVTDVSIAFTGDEIYDCTADEPEATVIIDQTDLDETCSNLSLGHDYVDCYDINEEG
ncbi:MAG: hypothetical protein KDK66_02075 [Deltaproteobacteria bacterium]|nr:hypothetical protein [Deltaproteobacteria bacterium]